MITNRAEGIIVIAKVDSENGRQPHNLGDLRTLFSRDAREAREGSLPIRRLSFYRSPDRLRHKRSRTRPRMKSVRYLSPRGA